MALTDAIWVQQVVRVLQDNHMMETGNIQPEVLRLVFPLLPRRVRRAVWGLVMAMIKSAALRGNERQDHALFLKREGRPGLAFPLPLPPPRTQLPSAGDDDTLEWG